MLLAEPVLSTGEFSASAPPFSALFQGMHELLAPIVFTLHCDHQAFLHASESAQPRQVFMGAPSIFQPCCNLFFNINTFCIEDFVNCKHLFVVHVADF